MAGEQTHWFLREGCNLPRCSYCFGPLAVQQAINLEQDTKLAKELVANGIKSVVLGGGEPLLASNIKDVLKTLKDGGIYTSLHTNGLYLTEERLDELTGLVDEIALPIDTTDRTRQSQLRSQQFLPVFDNIENLADSINNRGINLGWHTVFTNLNSGDIPALYDFLCQHNFKFWRIYEYNDDLARQGWLQYAGDDQEKVKKSYISADTLSNPGTTAAGGTDCLLADFLRMEETMQRIGDDRVCFVARKDELAHPYMFLRPNGDVNYYNWCSVSQRRNLGNILKDSLPVVMSKSEDLRIDFDIEKGGDYTRDWLDATADMPVWARLWEGIGSINEELDEIETEEQAHEVIRLANLWLKRNGGKGDEIKFEDYFGFVEQD